MQFRSFPRMKWPLKHKLLPSDAAGRLAGIRLEFLGEPKLKAGSFTSDIVRENIERFRLDNIVLVHHHLRAEMLPTRTSKIYIKAMRALFFLGVQSNLNIG